MEVLKSTFSVSYDTIMLVSLLLIVSLLHVYGVWLTYNIP